MVLTLAMNCSPLSQLSLAVLDLRDQLDQSCPLELRGWKSRGEENFLNGNSGSRIQNQLSCSIDMQKLSLTYLNSIFQVQLDYREGRMKCY